MIPKLTNSTGSINLNDGSPVRLRVESNSQPYHRNLYYLSPSCPGIGTSSQCFDLAAESSDVFSPNQSPSESSPLLRATAPTSPLTNRPLLRARFIGFESPA
jgi:hypothetical protein